MNIPPLRGNWIDLAIIAVIIYFVVEALRVGFWVILADFISFALSLIIALLTYPFVANFLRNTFSFSHSLANALGFLLIAVIIEGIIGYFLILLVRLIPEKFWKSPWNRYLAVIPAIGEGLILSAFILTLLISLPILPQIKTDVFQSRIGGELVKNTTSLETRLGDAFGGVIEDSLTYFTIESNSNESVSINVASKNLNVDYGTEQQMLVLVNNERTSRGLRALTWSESLAQVARAHATDMWERGYFAHVSPDGKDLSARLNEARIDYNVAGENLALAPTLDTAHQGLMNSPGHRANILDAQFGKVGIGVVDNGVYGKMFVQDFTN